MSYKYALRYKPCLEFRDEGYEKEDGGNGEYGLTDCFIGISILLPPDGSYSQAIVIKDNGKEKREMTQKEIFKAWLTLGMGLHAQGELKGWQKEFVSIHADMARTVMRNKK